MNYEKQWSRQLVSSVIRRLTLGLCLWVFFSPYVIFGQCPLLDKVFLSCVKTEGKNFNEIDFYLKKIITIHPPNSEDPTYGLTFSTGEPPTMLIADRIRKKAQNQEHNLVNGIDLSEDLVFCEVKNGTPTLVWRKYQVYRENGVKTGRDTWVEILREIQILETVGMGLGGSPMDVSGIGDLVENAIRWITSMNYIEVRIEIQEKNLLIPESEFKSIGLSKIICW